MTRWPLVYRQVANDPKRTLCEIAVPATRVTLPRYSDPAFRGVALTAAGELAVEARIQPGVRPDGELGAGVDARGVARGARTIDRASGIELVHPRQPRVRRQHHSIAESETGIELSTHEGPQRGHADRAVGQAERARGAGRHRVRLGEAVLPQFGELHGRKRRDREAAEHLLCAHFHAAAEEIAYFRNRDSWAAIFASLPLTNAR